LREVKLRIWPRRAGFENREHTDRLLLLMTLELNGLALEVSWARHIRGWLDERRGHPDEIQRHLLDGAGRPSLRPPSKKR